ncbi:uncharacterized protein LOC110466223 [Mizuhopecten yessoensis]|uniref:Chloride channel CLIC-like protein 1 n=1 Tax=Mizuhopecten yessoensis TaxID=6573 RepID=A0A210PPU4_MIZYE|nr:uncharacterized protein LOC110466223 [Mizuhopecten yessoensis]OWF38492.1 transmembrane protein ORF57 [Mizuhopecten yessoensis]
MAAIRNMTETRKRCNWNTCACLSITLVVAIIYGLIRSVTAWERSSTRREQHSLTFLSEVTNTIGWLLLGQSEDPTQISQSFSSHLLEVVKEDLQGTYILLVTWLCPLVPREITSAVAGIILLVFLLFTCIMSRKRSKRDSADSETTSENKLQGKMMLQRGSIRSGHRRNSEADHQGLGMYDQLCRLTYGKIVWILVILAFLGSLPWEFVRLYQIEIAKKMANLQIGVPKECVPDQMSFLQSFRNWLFSMLSWQPNPCEKYYKMLMVDPLWEVSPIMVISSTITRCIIYPMELFFEGVGRSLRLFFTEIPLHWQPLMFIAMVIILLITILVLGGYRLHVPFLFKMEPKTPVIVNKNVVVYNPSPNENSSATPKIKRGRGGGRAKVLLKNLQEQDSTYGRKIQVDDDASNRPTNKTTKKSGQGK